MLDHVVVVVVHLCSNCINARNCTEYGLPRRASQTGDPAGAENKAGGKCKIVVSGGNAIVRYFVM